MLYPSTLKDILKNLRGKNNITYVSMYLENPFTCTPPKSQPSVFSSRLDQRRKKNGKKRKTNARELRVNPKVDGWTFSKEG